MPASSAISTKDLFSADPVSVCGPAEKYTAGPWTAVVLHGSWREMGIQYGTLLRTEIRHTLEFANRRTNDAADLFFTAFGKPSGLRFMDSIFEGAAAGSGLTLPDLVHANAVEVVYGDLLPASLGIPPRGMQCSCAAFAPDRTRGHRQLFGRNYDWLPSFSELNPVVSVWCPDDGSYPVYSLNYAGCFYLTTGMNARGLFLELNAGLFAGPELRSDRIHNAWLLWRILFQTADTAEALRLLGSYRAAGNYLIGACDPCSMFSFEWAVNAPAAVLHESAPGILVMTNHFEQPGWNNTPFADVGGALSSRARHAALLRLARNLSVPVELPELCAMLETRTESGGAAWDGTLFQVIAEPEDNRWLLHRRGESGWTQADFSRFAGA